MPVTMTNDAASDARAVLDAAFNAYQPNDGARVRQIMMPSLATAIETAIADALQLARIGLGDTAEAIRSRDLADFEYGARAITNEVAAAEMGSNEQWIAFDSFTPEGQTWVAALVREVVASCTAARTRSHEEAMFWRREMSAMLSFDCSAYTRAKDDADERMQWYSRIRIQTVVHAYECVLAGDWHVRCEACGGFIRPGERDVTDFEHGGTYHVRCAIEGRQNEPRGPDTTDDDFAAQVVAARAILAPAEPAAPGFEPQLPCPACNGDTFISTGDRHTETAKDVCETCRGEGTIPAATGLSPAASAVPPADDVLF